MLQGPDIFQNYMIRSYQNNQKQSEFVLYFNPWIWPEHSTPASMFAHSQVHLAAIKFLQVYSYYKINLSYECQRNILYNSNLVMLNKRYRAHSLICAKRFYVGRLWHIHNINNNTWHGT